MAKKPTARARNKIAQTNEILLAIVHLALLDEDVCFPDNYRFGISLNFLNSFQLHSKIEHPPKRARQEMA